MTCEEWIIDFLREHHLKITTVESCTGGMISSRLVNVSGASEVLDEAYITYAAASKTKLAGVRPETIERYNVVSTQVAEEMACGGAKASKADVAISVTGVAGPSGGTVKIPVGTVCIGVYVCGKVISEKYLFEGSRYEVRATACDKAFLLVRKQLETYIAEN